MNNLHFPDDLILISPDAQESQQMVEELAQTSHQVGLEMNISKTKVMSLDEIQVAIGNQNLEQVAEYVYLGHLIKLGKENQTAEFTRRIRLSWAAFGKLSFILKDQNIPINLKRKTFNACVLPVMTYGLETMAITSKTAERMRVSQRAKERAMLSISIRDRVPNEEIRRRTRVDDVMERVARSKWQWAGHLARKDPNKCTKKILQWRPRTFRRGVGRPQKRWVDDIKKWLTPYGKEEPRRKMNGRN